jgi:hypothetical protein
MQLTATDHAYLRDCARRYAPQDIDLFEADVLDGVRVGMLLGDAIVEAWGAAAKRSMTRLTGAGPTSAADQGKSTLGRAGKPSPTYLQVRSKRNVKSTPLTAMSIVPRAPA